MLMSYYMNVYHTYYMAIKIIFIVIVIVIVIIQYTSMATPTFGMYVS